MADSKKESKMKNMGTALGAGILGAAAGAAAGAGAVLLSDKNNREKLKKAFSKAQEMGAKKMEDAKEQVGEMKEKAQRRLKTATRKK